MFDIYRYMDKKFDSDELLNQLLDKLTERQRDIASDDLGIFRDITSEIRKRLKEETKVGKSLENQNDLVNQINKGLRNSDKVARDSFDLVESRNLLLESEEDLQKKILQNQQNQIDLQREAKQLFRLSQQEQIEEGTSERLIKLSESLITAREEANLFEKKLLAAKEQVQELNNSVSVKLFDSLRDSAKNVPFLSKALEEASEATRKFKREQLSAKNIIEGLYGENLLKAIDPKSGKGVFGKGLDKKFFAKPENKDLAKEVMENSPSGKMSYGTGAANILKENKTVKKALLSTSQGFGKSLLEGTKAFGASLKVSLAPLAIMAVLAKELIEAIGKVDKETVELQKSFAASRLEAQGIRIELAQAAAGSNNINITTSKLLENLTALSKEFGFVAQFSSDTLVTMTKLTTQVGLTAQEAAQLAAAAEISDKSFEDIYQNVLGASYELQQQAGVQFDLREILKATNSVTGQVRANLGANPEAIAKAVTQAKLFGAELDAVVASSRALLDFQSSIESELEAELLLGRDINLETARQAALMGDQETVARELTKQAGNFTDFTKLNVIQQDALARAVGMQSDQLSDILFKQEVQNKTAKELRALGKDELANRLEQQTLADKFSATIDKIKGVVADVATAFLPFIQLLGDAFSLVNLILAPISDLVNALVRIPRLFTQGISAFDDFKFASKEAYGFGEEGAFASMNDGMIPPAGEGPILQRPEGSIQFNPKDTILAGTDLFGQTSLSQMPDYQQVMNQTNMVSPTINQGGSAAPIQTGATTINNQNVNQDFEQFVNRIEKVETAINNQTKVLAKGQDTIAKTKTKLQVGATDFGTDLNINSFRIQ